MKLLALDTSSVACSVALAIGETVVQQHAERPREHTRLLMPMIRTVLDEGEVTLAELDAIVLGNGPGSFIGMRIAASVAQGLAHGADLGIVPVSSLAAVAVAAQAEAPGERIVVVQDAHMSEVYLGLFEAGADGLPVALGAERIHGLGPIEELAVAQGSAWVAAGAGWDRYPDLFDNNNGFIARTSKACHPHATNLLKLGERQLTLGDALPPAELQPAYLRKKVAEPPATTS